MLTEQMNNEEKDFIPVKETKDEMDSFKYAQAEFERAIRTEKRTISQFTRDELEDRYLRLHDDHILLKKHARKQEDKIKKLATKLTRLVNDKKRLEQDRSSGVKKRDVEMEELVQDLQDRVRELERQNGQLREKLLVAKQQVLVRTKRPNGYNYVPSRIDSGRSKSGTPSRTSPATRTGYFRPSSRISPTSLPNYAWSVMEETRNEIKNLEEIINSQRVQIDVYEQEIDMIKEQLKLKEFEYNEEILNMKTHITQGQKKHVQENMDLIQLHREVQLKSSKMTNLQAQYNDLDEKVKSLKMSNDLLLKETDELNKLLREEQSKNLDIQEQLSKASSFQKTVIQLQEQINDLTGENSILKESNEKFISSALDEDRYQNYETRESTLKQQISTLEETIKSDLNEKDLLLSQLHESNEKNSELKRKCKKLEDNYNSSKEKLTEFENKLKIFDEKGSVDISYLEEALVLVQKKKSGEEISKELNSEEEKQLRAELHQAQVEHAETVAELEKTRNMLLLQYKINKDYEAELEAVNKKTQQSKKEYEIKLEEYSHLLELRESRIKKLERELNDIAYGTKQYKLKELHENQNHNVESTLELERGQNLFEIHVSEATFTKEGLHAMKDSNPSTFVTWTFYEFELQTTPILKDSEPHYSCTSQYIITADDFFLHYLQWGTTTFELHQAFGIEYKTIAASKMALNELLNEPRDRFHGTLKLVGIKEGEIGLLYGTLSYWVRFHFLMDQAITLYKERCKALGYIGNNQNIVKTALKTLDSEKDYHHENKVNELHIKILCCNKLQARNNDNQPSPYCVYKFYNLPDQDTAIIPSSNNPEFHDHKSFPLVISKEVDSYLKTQIMDIYVFDDTDLELSSYLGKTSISLFPLSQSKPIQGTFDLKSANGHKSGTIDVAIYWQSAYIPPTIIENVSEINEKPERDNEQTLTRIKSPPLPLLSTFQPPEIQVSKEDKYHISPKTTPIKTVPTVMPRKSLHSQIRKELSNNNGRNTEEKTDAEKELSKSVQTLKSPTKSSNKGKQVSFEINSESNEETDSEEVVVVTKLSRETSQVTDTIKITVFCLQLHKDSAVLKDPKVQMLFVEYRFLDYPSEELETPFALPKPSSSQRLIYNFHKVFHMSREVHHDKCQKLMNMMKSEENNRIIFTIVSEPPEGCQDLECEDIGYAFVNINEILNEGKDLIDHNIEIYDASDKKTVIGTLTVSIEAFAVLNALRSEM